MTEYIINTEQIKGITPYLLAAKTIPSWLACWALWDVSGAVPQRKDDGVAIGLPEIVRCRDCKHYYEVDNYRPNGNYISRCCKYFDVYMDEVEPDGFCAWGEKRSE